MSSIPDVSFSGKNGLDYGIKTGLSVGAYAC